MAFATSTFSMFQFKYEEMRAIPLAEKSVNVS